MKTTKIKTANWQLQQKGWMISFLFFGIISISNAQQATNENGKPIIPLAEITNENKSAIIITISYDTLKGTVNYNEYGKEIAHLKIGEKDGKAMMRNVPTDSILHMYIEGRGNFQQINTSADVKKLAYVSEDNESYVEYRTTFVGQGLLGFKISGGMIEGNYTFYLLNKKTGKLTNENHVKALSKNIDEYIDYCAEISEAVKNEEKGYKKSLIKTNYMLLKQVIKEAYTTCLN